MKSSSLPTKLSNRIADLIRNDNASSFIKIKAALRTIATQSELARLPFALLHLKRNSRLCTRGRKIWLNASRIDPVGDECDPCNRAGVECNRHKVFDACAYCNSMGKNIRCFEKMRTSKEPTLSNDACPLLIPPLSTSNLL